MVVYKILPRTVWTNAIEQGEFAGHGIDLEDGFIHLSSAQQVRETARLHFAGQTDLLLIEVDAEQLGESLTWESSRAGDLFPHVYGVIPMAAVTDTYPLAESAEGFLFPEDLPDA
ncbi:MAG: DUF952 domain-containing protein [Planctomycetota bacterium]